MNRFLQLLFAAIVTLAASPAVIAATLIDVRTPQEYAEGHVPGAMNIDHSVIAQQIGQLKLDKREKVQLYCRSGRRSAIAAEALRKQGFQNVEDLGSLESALQKLGKRK